jgi:hypothetical protein
MSDIDYNIKVSHVQNIKPIDESLDADVAL